MGRESEEVVGTRMPDGVHVAPGAKGLRCPRTPFATAPPSAAVAPSARASSPQGPPRRAARRWRAPTPRRAFATTPAAASHTPPRSAPAPRSTPARDPPSAPGTPAPSCDAPRRRVRRCGRRPVPPPRAPRRMGVQGRPRDASPQQNPAPRRTRGWRGQAHRVRAPCRATRITIGAACGARARAAAARASRPRSGHVVPASVRGTEVCAAIEVPRLQTLARKRWVSPGPLALQHPRHRPPRLLEQSVRLHTPPDRERGRDHESDRRRNRPTHVRGLPARLVHVHRDGDAQVVEH